MITMSVTRILLTLSSPITALPVWRNISELRVIMDLFVFWHMETVTWRWPEGLICRRCVTIYRSIFIRSLWWNILNMPRLCFTILVRWQSECHVHFYAEVIITIRSGTLWMCQDWFLHHDFLMNCRRSEWLTPTCCWVWTIITESIWYMSTTICIQPLCAGRWRDVWRRWTGLCPDSRLQHWLWRTAMAGSIRSMISRANMSILISGISVAALV